MIAAYLIDKSAYTRLGHDTVRAALESLLRDNHIAMCPMVALELLYSARSARDYDRVDTDLQSFPAVDMDADTWALAWDLQRRLSRRGQHRRAIPDLLISATALQHQLTVLHYDHDFELIAEISDLHQRWIVPRGSVD